MSEKEMLLQNIAAAAPITQQLGQIEAEISDLSDEREKKKKVGCGWIFVLFCAAIAALCGLGFIVLDKNFGTGFLYFAMGAVPIALFVMRILRAGECKKKISDLAAKYQSLRNDASLSWLPPDYRDSSCINAIASYLQNGRADSLKEAINLLETEQHNERMENAAALGAYFGAQSGRY